MTDTTPDEEPTGGMDRRSLLKRSAVVGGALVWTTPVVQSIGGVAFGATPSEQPPDPQGCLDGGGENRRYYFKADVSESGVITLSTGAGAGAPQCIPTNYVPGMSTPASILSLITVTVTGDVFTISLPEGFSLIEADVKVGGGRGNPDPDAPDGCFDVNLTTDTDPAAGDYEFELPDPSNDGTRGISNISVVFSGCVPA